MLEFTVSFEPWSHLATFAVGLCSGYALDWLRVRRSDRKQFALETFRPMLVEFNKALCEIENGQRAYSLDLSSWNQLKLNGQVDRIHPKLRSKLEDIYGSLAPSFDQAWQRMNAGGVTSILQNWESTYGATRETYREREPYPEWLNFLTSDTFRPSLINAKEGDRLRVSNLFISPQQLAGIEGGVNAFLRDRWAEAKTIPEIQHFKETRSALVKSIASAIPELKKVAK